MAGEVNTVADGSVAKAPSDKDTAVEKSVTEMLQVGSMWQSANGSSVARKPYGEPITEPSGQSTVIPPVEKIQEPKYPVLLPPEKLSEQMIPAPTAEERAKLLEKYGQSLKDQEDYARRESMSTFLIGTSLFASQVYAPLRMGIGGFGVAMNFYDGLKGRAAAREGTALLNSMPKADAQRFGKYQDSMHFYRDTTSGAYVAGGTLGAAHFTGLVKSANPVVAVGIGVVGLDAFNSGYLRPKVVSNFNSDFDAWKSQMKK